MRTINRIRNALDARRVARDLRDGICPSAPRTFEMTIIIHPMCKWCNRALDRSAVLHRAWVHWETGHILGVDELGGVHEAEPLRHAYVGRWYRPMHDKPCEQCSEPFRFGGA